MSLIIAVYALILSLYHLAYAHVVNKTLTELNEVADILKKDTRHDGLLIKALVKNFKFKEEQYIDALNQGLEGQKLYSELENNSLMLNRLHSKKVKELNGKINSLQAQLRKARK